MVLKLSKKFISKALTLSMLCVSLPYYACMIPGADAGLVNLKIVNNSNYPIEISGEGDDSHEMKLVSGKVGQSVEQNHSKTFSGAIEIQCTMTDHRLELNFRYPHAPTGDILKVQYHDDHDTFHIYKNDFSCQSGWAKKNHYVINVTPRASRSDGLLETITYTFSGHPLASCPSKSRPNNN